MLPVAIAAAPFNNSELSAIPGCIIRDNIITCKEFAHRFVIQCTWVSLAYGIKETGSLSALE